MKVADETKNKTMFEPMNTQQILTDQSAKDMIKRPGARHWSKSLLAIGLGALFASSAMLSANATIYSVNAVEFVSCITTDLLTAPLTVNQRQMKHAQNFNQ